MKQALLQPLEAIPGFLELKKKLPKNRGLIDVTGAIESGKAHFAAGLSDGQTHVLLVAENELRARELYEDYRLYDKETLYYPAKDMIFSDAELSSNLITQQRMRVVKALAERKSVSVVTSTGGCLDRLLPFRVLTEACVTLESGAEADTDSLVHALSALGYERVGEADVPGQFAVRGGILDVFALTDDLPWRIEFWGDEIDSIRSYDPESQRSIETLEQIRIYPATEDPQPFLYKTATSRAVMQNTAKSDTLPDYFPEVAPVFLMELSRIHEAAKALADEFHEAVVHRLEKKQIEADEANRMLTPAEFLYSINRRNAVGLSILQAVPSGFEVSEHFSVEMRSVGSYNNQFPMLVKDLKKWKQKGYTAVLLSASHTRARRLASELFAEGLGAFYSEDDTRALQSGELMVLYGTARKGFEYPVQRFVLITESDLFGRVRRKRKKKNPNAVRSFDELSIGDYVIHEGHGLGIYRGIEKVETDGTQRDFIRIEYAGGSNLYLPATQLDLLQKYGSADGRRPKINKLDGTEWHKTKTRIRGAVRDIAEDLVRLYAARGNSKGFHYSPDTEWQEEFEELFPYEETEDQLQAIEETKRDMESDRIMDRLICGDVGFGKTEVAIRAAFKAVQDGKQVVVLAPTTILAQQHYNTFRQRMNSFPVSIALMCRFRTPAQIKKTIEELKAGRCDIVIGTHRVLSNDVRFKDLGLLIIDEEQRFGVAHKEKIKQLKQTVDVLSLTATPIPRTLHMSMIGIRDMSVLEEAPLDRVPIQTYVMEQDDEIVREAISRELARGGQVYYVYNRVNDIGEAAGRISRLVPDARVAFAHGKMNQRELERIMVDFVDGEIDVLVSTTIIETGLDIANVNTIIVHDAERMGLSQLYQLRGRVGRSNRTAYAFLLYRRNKMLKEEAEKRLHAIREYTELGSGVRIAMRDLEIRGAGNLLGAEQSGHMEAVGYDLYCKMLREAVNEAKGSEAKEEFETGVDLVTDAYIPDSYIPDELQKLSIYKRISTITGEEDADTMTDELIDRFGDPPTSVMNLIRVARLRAEAHAAYIEEIRETPSEIRFLLYARAKLDVGGFAALLEPYRGEMTFHPVGKPAFIWKKNRAHMTAEQRMQLCSEFVAGLSKLSEKDSEM